MNFNKYRAEREMYWFDRLPPEWRALVREHEYRPDRDETMEQYLARVEILNQFDKLLLRA